MSIKKNSKTKQLCEYILKESFLNDERMKIKNKSNQKSIKARDKG